MVSRRRICYDDSTSYLLEYAKAEKKQPAEFEYPQCQIVKLEQPEIDYSTDSDGCELLIKEYKYDVQNSSFENIQVNANIGRVECRYVFGLRLELQTEKWEQYIMYCLVFVIMYSLCYNV